MRDITAITSVGVANSGLYDLLGFESAMAIVTLTTGYDASAVVVSDGDEKAGALAQANPDAVTIRFEGADGKTAKVGYIGAKRYISITGATVVALILQNPSAAPVGETKNPAAAASVATMSQAKASKSAASVSA